NGTITSNGTLNFIPSSSATVNLGTNFSSTGSVFFGGAGALTLAGTPISFNKVTISNTNSAGITPSSDWNITNNFTVNSGSIMNAGNHSYLVGGNISNSGIINGGTSTFTLNGSATQDVYSLSPFNNLTINNTAGVATQSSNATVNGVLNFVKGKIQTNTNLLILPSAGTITGAGQNTGWVNGKLKKYIATGPTARTFEVGDAVNYTPVSIAFSSVTAGGDLTAFATVGDHPNINGSGINPSKSVNRFWTLINNGTGFNNYTATLNFVASDIDAGAIASAFNVGLYNGVSWVFPVTASPNSTNIQVTGVTATGDLAIGQVCNVSTRISYPASPFCSNAGTGLVVLTGNGGGAYSSTTGLVIDAATGAVNLSSSITGSHAVTYTLGATGGCPAYITSANIIISAAPSATISYPGSPYCSSLGTAAITRIGTSGGTYSSADTLSINAVTGTVNLAASKAGTYTVTYTVVAAGGCTTYSTTTNITITTRPFATGTYEGNPYCSNGGIAFPTGSFEGLLGTLGSTAGLSIDPPTGVIDLATSIPGIYTVTYTVPAMGGCAVYTNTATVAITQAPSAIISYAGTPYCSGAGTASVTFTGTTGGAYSSTPGLNINPATGDITLATSTAGTYTVTYLVAAADGCASISATATVTIFAPSSATISYAGTPYCSNAGTASITRTGTGGGTYSSTAGLTINSTTGDITLASSTAGAYTVTYFIPATGCLQFTTTALVTVSALPSATISYAGTPYCSNGGTASVTRTGTAGGAYSSTAGLTLNPGTGAITLATSIAGTYTVTYTMVNGGCIIFANTSVIVNASPTVSGTSTATCVGGSTGTITATGAGGTTPYTYSLNSGAYQASSTFSGLAAATYTLNIKSNSGCIVSTTVTVSPYATSADDQNATATNTWVGHIYDGISFTNYIGHFTEAETFNEVFGGSTTCFNVVSNSATRSIYTETFSVKYRMTSTRKGLFVVDLGSDDGSRLTIGTTTVYDNWVLQSWTSRPTVLISLNGASPLLYEFYEQGGENRLVFQNLTLLLANSLSTNVTQNICMGNLGSAISGDIYGTLPPGITLSGTGYQWTYSTTPAGTRTNITGATGASYIPSTTIAPFNSPGTYYIYRNSILTSNKNISPNPYVATNESNAATLTVAAVSSATIGYSGSPYCSNSGIASVTRTGTAGGTYTSTTGLNINSGTGDITLGTSTAGVYTVTYTMVNGGCTTMATTPVTVTAAPSASISYTGTPYCSNAGTATVTRTGTAGGTYSSTAGLSIDPITGVVNPGTSVLGAYTVSYIIPANGVCAQFQITTSIAIVTAGTWTGAGNSNWNDGVNWLCGAIPTSTTNVTIPGSLINYPILNSGTGSVQNITIQSGASITVLGGTLQIGGTISNAGTFNSSGGTIEMNGLSPQIIPANAFAKNSLLNLVINNNVTLAGQDTLTGTLTIGTSNKTFATGGFLTLKSTATSTARVAPIPVDGTGTAISFVTGNVTVERFIPGKRAWRLLTSPLWNTGSIYNSWQNGGAYVPGKGMFVTGPNPGIANGLDPSSLNTISMKTYDANTQLYLNINDTKSTNLSNSTGNSDNVGYFVFVRGDRNPNNLNAGYFNSTTLQSAGKLQTGKQIFASSGIINNYTIMGNPYASPIDFNNVKRSHLIKRFYAWDPSLNSLGAYVAIDDIDGNGIFSKSVPGSLLNQHIQSGQAFFVQTDSTGAGSLTIFESSKSSLSSNAGFRPFGQIKSIEITLNLVEADNSIILADGVVAEFDDIFCACVNLQDAAKFANTNETISFLRNNVSLAIERRPLIISDDTLFLKLVQSTQRNYQLVIVGKYPGEPNLLAFLEDSYTGNTTSIDLVGSTTVDFTINGDAASINSGRFRLVFKQSLPLPVTYSDVKAWRQGNNIAVRWNVENELNIRQYEVQKSYDGRNFTVVNTQSVTGAGAAAAIYNWLDIHAVAGDNFYRIRSIDRDGTGANSKVVSVNIESVEGGMEVYPNPATGGVIGLQLNNMAPGKYKIRLLNHLGQLLLIKDIYHAGGSASEKIKLSKGIVKGIYDLEIINPDKRTTVISVVNQ
ncbi:MAG: SprB repeat-containing protein, partial [Ferruginibacter sp.]